METFFLLLIVALVGVGLGIGAGIGFAFYQDRIRIDPHDEKRAERFADTVASVASGEVSIPGIYPATRDALVEELADIALAYAGPAQLAAVQCVVNDPERLLKEHKALWRQVAIRIISDSAGMGEDEKRIP